MRNRQSKSKNKSFLAVLTFVGDLTLVRLQGSDWLHDTNDALHDGNTNIQSTETQANRRKSNRILLKVHRNDLTLEQSWRTPGHPEPLIFAQSLASADCVL